MNVKTILALKGNSVTTIEPTARSSVCCARSTSWSFS